jgi:L-threonylcarbamoyladenylate synthase
MRLKKAGSKVLSDRSQVIDVTTGEGYSEGISQAGRVLLSGGVVAFPTESFYGLAVNPADEEAIDRLFLVKKREPDQPILILLPSLETLGSFAAEIPDSARQMIERFWPGGLTILFRANPWISQKLTAGTGKIGVRLLSHALATGLASSINSAITGTSANISGYPACRTAMEVYKYFQSGVLILDGGETAGGKGSTIVDVTSTPPEIIREGMIDPVQLGLE